ncbi:MAG: sulfatase-like hydrolase/transferase [Methylotenera sp.]|nr:sulfatase-like hydrolase/transferase [Methylotenera sp.]MDO9388333.1 sulfatase-like hydrolase/transferase [Methylotenera sp.]
MLSHIQQLHHHHRHVVRGFVRFFTYLAALFLISIAYWIADNFGEPSLEQILYHAQFGVQGLVDTDAAIIKSFLSWCIALPLLTSILLVLIEYSIALFLTHGSSHWLTRPARRANIHFLKVFYWFIGHRAPLYTLVIAGIYFGMQFSLTVFIQHHFGKDYFAEHYVTPVEVEISQVNPKNLVLIYVESLEDSYKDPDLFGKNLLARLDHLKGSSFANYKTAPGSWWTIAGITATQCALPLKSVSLYDGNDQGEKIKAFLPNAVCLGDILHDAGYHSVYIGGDALAFAGKGMFFQDHHYDEIYGREELKGNLKSTDMNYWGLYDDDLLKVVKEKLIKLHAKQQPFNLTFTTIDTHGPDGHFSKYCKARGVKDFEGIVECSANQVSELVEFITKSGYLKDTSVVILGDHLAMENPVYEKLKTIKERHIFNRFISNDPISKNREDVLPFDMFPTILEFIGFKVHGGKLGLGYSAISKGIALPPATEYEEMNKYLLNKSNQYLDLWKRKAVTANHN